jgi:hypothetical protein
MSSDLRRSSRKALFLLAAIAALPAVLTVIGCGNQGDPAPPLRAVPAPTRNLAIHQQGERLILELSYPQTTAAGTALGGVTAVEVWEAQRSAPDGKLVAIDPREFTAAGTLTQTIQGADLNLATFGDQIVVAFPLPQPLPATPEARYYAVRTVGPEGDRSEPSNIAGIVAKAPPSAPERINTIARTDGVRVEWTAVEGAAGYNVYRRASDQRSHGRPIQTVAPEETSWLDTTARYGKSYIYAVTAVAQREPLVESAIAGEREVRYQDRFPPPVPGELVALPEAGRVRLVWRSSEADDLAGYLVYRRGPEGDFARITERPVQTSEYIDTDVASGRTYTYRVTAVDQTGNESEPGSEVRAPIPQ